MGVLRGTGVAAIAAAAAMAVGCGGDDVGIRERDDDARPSREMSAMLDGDVLKELQTSDTVGRIIYDPPPDLSYASAQLRRPDLVKPDASGRRDTSRATASAAGRRDTTGRDTTADPSGGAARPRPQRP